ncbi:MAG: hypothetical protein J5779_02860, partial [Clostridia bacterium]|nr:hypothetical protein [Clostridia bacterium]
NNYNYINVTIKLYNLLNYYILTRNLDSNYQLLFKIMSSVDANNMFLSENIIFDGLKKVNKKLNDEELATKLIQNFYNNGFIVHACNPIYINNLILNGLGSNWGSNEIETNLIELEEQIYKNKFLKRQSKQSYYYSFPSANSIHYAVGMPPEKVFGGPLKILNKNTSFDDNTLFKYVPYIYQNEKIVSFYKKIAKHNLKTAIFKNSKLKPTKKSLKKKLYKLINDFCFSYSYLLLIPINKCEIMAYNKSVDEKKEQTLEYYLKNLCCGVGVNLDNAKSLHEVYDLIKFITPKSVGQNDKTYMANLCSNKVIKNTKDILKIKIPVFFELTQYYLKINHILRKKLKINPYIDD